MQNKYIYIYILGENDSKFKKISNVTLLEPSGDWEVSGFKFQESKAAMFVWPVTLCYLCPIVKTLELI